MNVKNNKRRKESQQKIEKAFIDLLQTQAVKDISVSELCKSTGLNRSTFYANYMDVFDLADHVRQRLKREFGEAFADFDYMQEHTGALRMFTHIKENQLFYKTYFKLCTEDMNLITTHDDRRAEQVFGNKHLDYHIEFFRNGFNAIVKMWLARGCAESPEEMAQILQNEYRGR